VVARLLGLVLALLERRPACAGKFLASNLTGFLVGILTDGAAFVRYIQKALKIFTAMSLFLSDLVTSDPALIGLLTTTVLAYASVPYPQCIPPDPNDLQDQQRDYLQSGLPLLTKIFSISEVIDEALAVTVFQQLQVISTEKFAFDGRARAPAGSRVVSYMIVPIQSIVVFHVIVSPIWLIMAHQEK
jgi:hypothetical protein